MVCISGPNPKTDINYGLLIMKKLGFDFNFSYKIQLKNINKTKNLNDI